MRWGPCRPPCPPADAASAVRLSVLSFDSAAHVRLAPVPVTWQTGVPTLTLGTGCRLAPLARSLLARLPPDIEHLKSQSRVNRPVLFLLLTGAPEDGGEWPDLFGELRSHRYGPTIVLAVPEVPTHVSSGTSRAGTNSRSWHGPDMTRHRRPSSSH